MIWLVIQDGNTAPVTKERKSAVQATSKFDHKRMAGQTASDRPAQEFKRKRLCIVYAVSYPVCIQTRVLLV